MQFAHFCISPNFGFTLAARKRMRNCCSNLRVRSGFRTDPESQIPVRRYCRRQVKSNRLANGLWLVYGDMGIWLSYSAPEFTKCPTNNTRSCATRRTPTWIYVKGRSAPAAESSRLKSLNVSQFCSTWLQVALIKSKSMATRWPRDSDCGGICTAGESTLCARWELAPSGQQGIRGTSWCRAAVIAACSSSAPQSNSSYSSSISDCSE